MILICLATHDSTCCRILAAHIDLLLESHLRWALTHFLLEQALFVKNIRILLLQRIVLFVIVFLFFIIIRVKARASEIFRRIIL